MRRTSYAGALILILACWSTLATATSVESPAARGCREVAALDVDGGVDWERLDPRTAVPRCWAALKAEPKNAAVQAYYGRALRKAERFDEALKVIRTSAEVGHPTGLIMLASIFQSGQGLPRDEVEAIRLYKLAAEQGSVVAQVNLGFIYANAQDVLRNNAEAARWYQLAAKQGYAPAQVALGFMYKTGNGVAKNEGEALRLFRLAADQGNTVAQQNLSNLAIEHMHAGRYGEAEPVLQRVTTLMEKALGPEHPEVARSLHNLSAAYGVLGRYNEAETHLKRVVVILEKTLGPDHPEVARSLGGLAFTYNALGRQREAEPLYRRAIVISEKALGSNHPDVARSLIGLAGVNDVFGASVEAEALRKRGITILETVFGPDHPEVAFNLLTLAAGYSSAGRHGEAESLYRRAIAALEKALGPEHPQVVRSLTALAWMYVGLGRREMAEPLYERVVAALEKTQNSDQIERINALRSLAELKEADGRTVEALEFSRKAARIAINNPTLYLGSDSDMRVARPIPRLDGHLSLLHYAHTNRYLETEAVEEAFQVAQLVQLRSSAAVAIGRMSARLASQDDTLAQLIRDQQDSEQEYGSLNTNLVARLQNSSDHQDRERANLVRQRLIEVRAHLNQIKSTISAQFPSHASSFNQNPVHATDIQRLLGPDEAMLYYFIQHKDRYVWAITREKIDWHRISISPEELNQKVEGLRDTLNFDWRNRSAVRVRDGAPSKQFNLKAAYALYREVVAPVYDVIAAKSELIVVASGALGILPFHVLVTEEPSGLATDTVAYRSAAWFVRNHAVTILPSVESLRYLREKVSRSLAPNAYLGFGDPVFSQQPALSMQTPSKVAPKWALPRLSDTADELRAIAQILDVPGNQIRLGAEASESSIKRLPLDQYRILHFATHALTANEMKELSNSANSALLSAGANSNQDHYDDGSGDPALALSFPEVPSEVDDGFLTGDEVAQLKLNADWVILSACNTAAGEKSLFGSGYEVPLSGLASAFIYAGARTLLVSHWPVESTAAVRLTTGTILRKQEEHLSPAESLRRTMVELLEDDSDPRNADPRRWAPFVIVGTQALAQK
jgi:TPR repeat protein/CHAT domain-containing protein